MLILIIALLANCNKMNFNKKPEFYNQLKPQNQNESNDIRRDFEYVVSGKTEREVETAALKKLQSSKPLEIKPNYSGAKHLIDMQSKEKEAYEKALKAREEENIIKADNSDSKTFIDFIRAEEKAHQKRVEKENQAYKPSQQDSFDSSSSFFDSLNSYEDVIWGKEDSFC